MDLFYDILTLENALKFGAWALIFVLIAIVAAKIWLAVYNASAKNNIIAPDDQGRYPILRIPTAIGTLIYDRETAFGLHLITHRGEILTTETPDLVLKRYGDIEIARASALAAVPSEITNTHSPAYTYAPTNSREATLVDNDSSSKGGDDDLLAGMLGEKPDSPPPPPSVMDYFRYAHERETGHVIVGVNPETEAAIQVPISELFHQLVGGMSGYGKSVYLRTLALQLLAESQNSNIQIGLADIENNTFPEFRGKRGIRWYAGSYVEIEQMTKSLLHELEDRKKLYESFGTGTPKDIVRYNVMARRAGVPELPMIVVMYDEFTALMHRSQAIQKRIIADVYQLALRARKYGIFLVLAGQSYKADVLDSTVVGQFSVNICFRVRTVHTSISVLGEGGGEALNVPGEALMKAKTGEISRIKGLWIDDDALLDELDAIESESTATLVPDLVRAIVHFCNRALGNKVLFRNVEQEFKPRGYSRQQIHDALVWMDEHEFVVRNDRNGRVLNVKSAAMLDVLLEAAPTLPMAAVVPEERELEDENTVS